MKHYEPVKIFVKFSECQAPYANLNPCSRLSGNSSGFQTSSFHATV